MMKCKKIPGFSGYCISESAVIKNVFDHEMKQQFNHKGYCTVRLVNDCGVQKSMLVHRLVALTFLCNTLKLPEVNHLDGNKKNNHVNNLEWSSSGNNQLHAYRLGLKVQLKGQDHSRAKLTEYQVSEIKRKYKTGDFTLISLGALYGVSKSTISYIVNNQTWKHQKAG